MLSTLIERPEHDDSDAPSPRVVVVATHDRELIRLLDRQYAAYHFTDTVGSGGLSFDYRLREGPAVSRNAVALLEACGAPARVVRRAEARQADLDRVATR
jgi:DNA mismatch repair ATPase MutS